MSASKFLLQAPHTQPEANDEESPKSAYSSAWETSESETEGFEDPLPRGILPARSVSEDNQAKMSQQGAKGQDCHGPF